MIGGIFLFQAASGAIFDWYVDDWAVDDDQGYRMTFATLAACQLVGLIFYKYAPSSHARAGSDNAESS